MNKDDLDKLASDVVLAVDSFLGLPDIGAQLLDAVTNASEPGKLNVFK